MKNLSNIFYWGIRILAAVILVQTLYFKFTASAESVYIFTTVGLEPWGRIGIGVFELIAAVLLIIPATAWLGSAIALGLMVGALGMHLTILGIEIRGDGGYLFFLAVVVFSCSIFILYMNAEKIVSLLSHARKKL